MTKKFKLRTWVNNNSEEDTKKYAAKFDKKKIFIKKAGVKYNVYDEIQAANVDLDIYETLEKYNMLPTRENAEKMLSTRGELIYGDMRAAMAEHPQEYVDRANKLWETLPLDVRREFNHDKAEFARNGMEWLKTNLQPYIEKKQREAMKAAKIEALRKAQQETTQTTQTTQGEQHE